MKIALRKFLRAKAHTLKPVVITGHAGISDAVLKEIDLALNHHELMKVRINALDREVRREMAEHICQELQAEPVQMLGHVLTLYRLSPDK